MKSIFFCSIKILFIIIFFSNNQLLFSQIQTDMIKYWYYRNRLQYFVVPGDKIGESQIVCVRNSLTTDPYDVGNKFKNVDYGQHGKYTGLYLGTLATEYYLLNNNGQYDDAVKIYQL